MATTLHALSAGQIMSGALVTVPPGDLLTDAEAMLIEQRVGGLPVVEQGKLVGVLSRSDITRVRVLMASLDGLVTDLLRGDDEVDGFRHSPRPEYQGSRQMLASLKVKDAMHDQVNTCTVDTPVVAVARMMIRLHVHRVIVVEGDRPLGVISSLDLVKLLVPAE